MRFPVVFLLLLSPVLYAQETPLTAAEIMARVAVNQDAADAERAHFVYVQHANVQSRKGKTVLCAETTDSRVTPGVKGSTQTLLSLDGRVLIKGKVVSYHELPKKPVIPDELKDDDSLPKDERQRRRKEREKSGTPTGLWIRTWLRTCVRTLRTTRARTALPPGCFR